MGGRSRPWPRSLLISEAREGGTGTGEVWSGNVGLHARGEVTLQVVIPGGGAGEISLTLLGGARFAPWLNVWPEPWEHGRHSSIKNCCIVEFAEIACVGVCVRACALVCVFQSVE